jgi:hypothetical protein
MLFPLFSPDYHGVYMMEIQPRFASEYKNALSWMQRMTRGKENCV